MTDGHASSCPDCGAPARVTDRFCGTCGFDLAAHRASQAARDPKRTMLGMTALDGSEGRSVSSEGSIARQGPAVVGPGGGGASPAGSSGEQGAGAARATGDPAEADVSGPRPSAPPAGASPARGRTMIGMQSPVAGGAIVPPGVAPAGGRGSAGAGNPPNAPASPSGPPPPQLAATQVGLQASLPPAASGEPPEAGGAAHPKRTMLGMPAVPSAPPPSTAGAPDAVAPPGSASGGPPGGASSAAPPPASGRTMLGLPASQAPVPSESMRPPGMPAALPGADAPGRRRNEVAYRSSWPQDAGAPPPPVGAAVEPSSAAIPGLPQGRRPGSSRGGRLGWVLLGLGGLLVGLVVVLLAVWLFGNRGPEVEAQVTQSAQGEVLEVTVPGARPGTKVRLGGAEAVLDGNRAEFPLAAEGLAVGENTLALDVVGPEGDVQTAELQLRVDFRVRADLSGLRDDDPAVRIMVDAPPGTEATLDGQALPLDEDGRGVRRFPLAEVPPDDDGFYDLSVAYHLELPNGEVEDGRVRSRVPYATLQIDRPGRSLVTDRKDVEVAGAVDPTATVTLDGRPVTVEDGRFLERIALEAVGERQVQVVAREPGKAPVTRTITIRRVDDLAEAAADFDADDSLTYAKLAQNPTIYRGQKVEMVGRVYNVRVQDGRSILQVLVEDCPRGQACPLWVVYPAATEATLHDWVRILGKVAGEQQFKAETDRIVTVPRVDATYVLEARP